MPDSKRGGTRSGPKRIADFQHGQLLLEAAPDAMVVIDPDGVMRMVNEAAERLFGYTRTELVGQPVELLVPEAATSRHVGHRNAYVKHPSPRNMGSGRDLSGRRKDGTTVPVEISLNPLDTPNGLLVVAAIRDISDRRRQAEALKQSEGRLELAAGGANLGLWDAHVRSGEILVNAIFEQQLLYAPMRLRESDDKWARLRGGLAGWPAMLHPEDRDKAIVAIRDQLAGEIEEYRVEHRVLCGDGTYKWILSVGRTSERGADGLPSRVAGVHIDISVMKTLQATLERRYAELQQLQDLRDNLTHMIVHDLRSPLTGIMMSLSFLQDGPEALSKVTREVVNDASDATSTLVELISSMLDVSRLESGEMPLNKTDVDLGVLAEEALGMLRGLAAGRSVQCDRSEGPVPALCDAELVRRVIANLLGNALKFTPGSGSIVVAVTSRGGQPRVEVRDTGRGIPEEHQARIFDKFGQVGSRARYSTGLGLTFCKLAVEAHGGSIGVTSSAGTGSTFWFQLSNEPALT